LCIPVPSHPNPLQEIVRTEKRFNPLRLPKKLEAALPFKSKPKNQAKRSKEGYLKKR
jgi:ribosome biogenesis protein BMS1